LNSASFGALDWSSSVCGWGVMALQQKTKKINPLGN